LSWLNTEINILDFMRFHAFKEGVYSYYRQATRLSTPRLPNLLLACPKWHAAFTALPIIFFCSTGVSILWILCVYIHTYIHKSHCVETVHELSLLPRNTGTESFLHKSGTVPIVDWIFITGAPAWRWLGEYVTMGTIFYSLLKWAIPVVCI